MTFPTEGEYKVPTSGKDGVPNTAEGMRQGADTSSFELLHLLVQCFLHIAQCVVNHVILNCLTVILCVARSFSEVQESANLLGGASMPRALLSSLLNGVQLPSQDVGLFNMTAFDGSLEMFCNTYWEESGKKVRIWTCSTSLLPDHAEFSQRVLALQFLAEPRLDHLLLHRFVF